MTEHHQIDCVIDKTVEYELRSRFSAAGVSSHTVTPPPLSWVSECPRVHWRDAFDGHLQSLREELHAVKSQLDATDENSFRMARDALFPLAKSGSSLFSNRAGHKLDEAMQVVGVWPHLVRWSTENGGVRSIAFADVCGGPGAFSQALYATVPRRTFSQLKGFGMTLYSDKDDTLNWYSELIKKHKFTVTYGVDGTGNIYLPENIHALQSLVQPFAMQLVVADGGFDIAFDVVNYQETISARIVFGQWLAAVAILKKGGCFVLKMFDTFAPITRSMLFLSTLFFDHVHIVKPKHSRVVNSERYLVCVGMRELSPQWEAFLFAIHENGFADDSLLLSCCPPQWVADDVAFCQSMEESTKGIATTQIKGLRMILASPILKSKGTEQRVET